MPEAKPEDALKQALALLQIGQTTRALDKMHTALLARRYKIWNTSYQNIMMKYVEVCVAEGRGREIKDGLHQYRNMCQQQAPGSLETVVRRLVELSEQKLKDKKEKAKEMGFQEAVKGEFRVGVGGMRGMGIWLLYRLTFAWLTFAWLTFAWLTFAWLNSLSLGFTRFRLS